MLLIFSAGVLGGLLPRRIGKSARGNTILALGSAFSGGIFLGAGLIHLLADGLELMNDALGDVEFPWAFFILGTGFLIILLIEKVLSKQSEDETAQTNHPYILLLILSVHSIIAGTALGLEASIAGSFVLLFAVLAHKSFASFALGVSLHGANVDRTRARNLILFFSIMTPLGVAFGAALQSLLESDTIILAEAIFDSLAAGTFLYVATLDILKESFESKQHLLPKFLLVALGFLLMALIAIWA